MAILLMILDHVLVVSDPGSVVRLSITRLALPLFVASSRLVWHPTSPRRFRQLALAAVAEVVLTAALGMPQPGIVVLFVGWLYLVRRFPRGLNGQPYVVLVLGLIQVLYLPMWRLGFESWTGYQPGLLAVWWSAAAMIDVGHGEPWTPRIAARVPSVVRAIGRRPLAWYLGHLAVLVAVTL